MTEIQMVYDFLEKIGFTHPLHPAMTHIPMGMVLGALTFRIASFLPRLEGLAKTAYHCVVLGFLGMFPTVIAGLMDWQHRFEGAWEGLIIGKMVLAGILAILMVVIMVMDDPENRRFLDKRTGFYFLMILVAVGLGYSGGELTYG